jgi:hypothetical protein
MFTTIEPRLIALLNNDVQDDSPTSPSLELPPLHDPNILKASGRPLLLEPDTSKRNGKLAASSQLAPKHKTLIAPIEEDDTTHNGNEGKQKSGKAPSDRALGVSSPQSLRKILDDDTDSPSSISSKKRHIAETSKDDFVQLPQPPKKQKAAKQVVPPIIIGLFEPPPQAALFPPIASSSFHDSHGRNSLNTVPPKVKELKESSKHDSSNDTEERNVTSNATASKKNVRARKKWTEEETNNLLLGVHKHGVGNWADILEDKTFLFNGRSGSDLKDRWRTCCPAELRGKVPNAMKSSQTTESGNRRGGQPKSKSSLMSENILIDEDDATTGEPNAETPRRSRAHRKKLEDLAQLGIEGPFRKSRRRERRPFSEDEDRQILEGYNLHGPAWTSIQRDPQFQLQSRKPTDLRDRFRNKYPEKFRSEEKAGKESSLTSATHSSSSLKSLGGRGKDNLVSNVGQATANSHLPGQDIDSRSSEMWSKEAMLPPPQSSFQTFSNRDGLRIQEIISSEQDELKAPPLQHQSSLFGFKDNFSTFADQAESTDGLPFSQSFDWNPGIAAPFSNNINEMDISRLLLDEPWPDLHNGNGKEKQSFTDINSIITPSDPLPSGPSFFNMLNDSDQIVELNDSTFG